MKEQLVSVIIPVYNAERFLSQAIQSILDQTYKNIELIIIDDGSTDKSRIIIKNFSDERIKSFFFENRGVSKTRNFGISIACGEFIALMDADDISESNRIEKQLEYLLTNKEIDILGTNCVLIDENGKNISKKKYPSKHKEIENTAPLFNPLSFPTMMISIEKLNNIQGYNEDLVVSEDHDLILRLLLKNNKINNIQEYLYRYRIVKNSLSHKFYNTQRANHYKISLFYLDNLEKENKAQKDNFRRGLLEYYYGNVSTSRKYLLKSFFENSGSRIKVLRMIVISFVGNRVITYLREKGVLKFINRMILKLFRINLQKI